MGIKESGHHSIEEIEDWAYYDKNESLGVSVLGGHGDGDATGKKVATGKGVRNVIFKTENCWFEPHYMNIYINIIVFLIY